MKARKEDGQINFYGELPSKFLGVTGNYVGGFNLMDVDTHEREGFFDVVEPDYNRILEALSPIFFDETKKVFTYTVIPKPDLPTLEQAKIDKIAELKLRGRNKFNETDWYYTRELRMKDLGIVKPIPPEIIQQNQDLYALLDTKESEINAITSLEQVLNVDTSIEKPVVNNLLPEEPAIENKNPETPVDSTAPVENTNPTQNLQSESSSVAPSEALPTEPVVNPVVTPVENPAPVAEPSSDPTPDTVVPTPVPETPVPTIPVEAPVVTPNPAPVPDPIVTPDPAPAEVSA